MEAIYVLLLVLNLIACFDTIGGAQRSIHAAAALVFAFLLFGV